MVRYCDCADQDVEVYQDMKQFSGVPQNVHINFPAGDVWRPSLSAPGVPGPRQTDECRVSSSGRPR